MHSKYRVCDLTKTIENSTAAAIYAIEYGSDTIAFFLKKKQIDIFVYINSVSNRQS